MRKIAFHLHPIDRGRDIAATSKLISPVAITIITGALARTIPLLVLNMENPLSIRDQMVAAQA